MFVGYLCPPTRTTTLAGYHQGHAGIMGTVTRCLGVTLAVHVARDTQEHDVTMVCCGDMKLDPTGYFVPGH